MKRILILIAALLAIGCTPVEAKTLQPEALGGLSYQLEKYFETNDELYNEHDLQILSAAMQLENGSNSDLCLLLTGSVILNRVASDDWFANSVEGVILQGYGTSYQQYASRTVENLYTVEVTERVRSLALHLLLCGSIDKEIIFQSQYPNLGKVVYVVDKEYFAK